VFAALGRFAYRRRWYIIAVWAVILPLAVYGAAHVHGVLKGGGFSIAGSPSDRALQKANEHLSLGKSALYIVFESKDLNARQPEFMRRQAEALAAFVPDEFPYLTRLETFANVRDPNLVSRDNHASMAILGFSQPFDKVQAIMPRIRAAVRDTGLKHYITGEPAVFQEIEQISSEDATRAEYYTLPVALVVMILVFGSVVAAGLPILGGVVAVSTTLGFMFLFGRVYDMSIYTLNVTTMLGLAVGIDYSLLMVGRFREQLVAGDGVARAVEVTMARAGASIFFSGLAVMVGLTGLIIFQFMALRSMGIGGCLVVGFSVLVALTLLPAVLAVLGPRVDFLRIYHRRGTEGAFWMRWSAGVMRHPVWVVLGVTTVIVLLSVPAFRMQTGVSTSEILPPDAEARIGDSMISSRFNPSLATGILVLVTWDDGSSPFALTNVIKLWNFGNELKRQPGVSEVTSAVTPPDLKRFGSPAKWFAALAGEASGSSGAKGSLSGDAYLELKRLMSATAGPGALLYVVVPKWKDNSPQARELATKLAGLQPPTGTKLWIGGVAAGLNDFLHGLYGRFPWVVIYVLCATFLVFLVMLRSLLLPLKAVIVNGLSIVACFGALVFIFQEGHFSSVLGFESSGWVESTLPVILFCIIFGVSMDYEVFMLTRMREYWLETQDNVRSVGMGLARTGRIITSAALIIVVVAGAFAFTSIVVTKALGVGLAIAVALDATIVRVLLVPAAMRLFGHWNWWLPKWLDKVIPHVVTR
jgi:putative drug exporter of the RND superfamily